MSTEDSTPKNDSGIDCKSATTSDASDLTAFQKAILAVLAENSRYGLAIKRALEEYYGEEVNHGRLYPNLDDLVNKRLVEKSELDKRTNEYALTDAGIEAILEDVKWQAEHVRELDHPDATDEDLGGFDFDHDIDETGGDA